MMFIDLPRYTNEPTQQELQRDANITQEQLHESGYEKLSVEEFRDKHPIIGVYRLATQGSETRQGGYIKNATTTAKVLLENGDYVPLARVGDEVVYPDGSTAKIISGSGKYGHNFVLVGSRVENGDEVINTLQNSVCFTERKDIPLEGDFLVCEA